MNGDALLTRIAQMQAAAGASRSQGKPGTRPQQRPRRASVTSRVESWLALIEKRCALLAEDRRFIRLRLATQQNSEAMRLAKGYCAAWEQAAMQEQLAHVKSNAGRQAANLWLKRQLDKKINP
ncbi:hypothetical protein [Halomonas llamarensis]|uniref:Uncharacterized protein n=1 Tax=Halomonas llamarensis TaxID=2945104 RepID=A0ABT0SMY3_9GAMM|nr:hypothetical protein [Halomonas llamarensis]MCL7929156.1 hypothetical protein [Halomonas llamarensis]